MSAIKDALQHAWNIFMNKDPTRGYDVGPNIYYRQDRPRLTRGNERTLINTVINRIAVDAASVSVKHVRLDEEGRYLEDINSDLNNCLTLEANIDQTARQFLQDVIVSMLDEGVVCIVPVDTDIDIKDISSFKIYTMRVGKIVEWFPEHVKVNLYNQKTGNKEDVIVSKKSVCIIENPFYSIMNEPNSTMQRLVRKLSLMDVIDEQHGAGKLDLIIQLPYVIKSEARRKQAELRRKDIENQLAGSQYGIAYTDGTEHITQLNRSVDNQLLNQVEYLTGLLYSQLGITTSILDGTADDKTMNNYYTRTIEPILSAITDEMNRKFLSKTARTQKQSIRFFRDPFKLLPVSEIPEIADKFTRNEILTSNEIRQIVGMKPASDPSADELRNKNLSAPAGQEHMSKDGMPIVSEEMMDEMPPEEPIMGETEDVTLNDLIDMPISELMKIQREE